MLDKNWRKSSTSGANGCIEVRYINGIVQLRDSKYPLGSILTFNVNEWEAFQEGVRSGEFNLKEQL